MNWKIFTIVCINILCISFPYNIIGCASDDPDPYDYYVSFFNTQLPEDKGFEPFYYTNMRFLYKDDEPENTSMVTAGEWVPYGGNSFSQQDAYEFVVGFPRKDLSTIYFHIEKNQPAQLPDSLQRNGMAKFFLNSKDLEALGYLMYAKQVEPNVTGEWFSWQPIERDTAKMGKLIKNGLQLHAAAKKDFIKLRLAYQVMRLAHYSHRYLACEQFFDELVKPNTTKSVLQDLCLSLKAGALANKNESAYIFSQLFSKSPLKRVSNYMSFDWCVKRFDQENRNAVLEYCKNDLEKANLLGLFALGSNRDELSTLEQIHQLAPESPMNEVLLVREMNKLEENYFDPSLQFKKGKEEAIVAYRSIKPSNKEYEEYGTELANFIGFCQEAAKDKKSPNKALYSLTAAHGLMIQGDYAGSRKWLDNTKKLKLTPKLEDQWGMTNLLWTINQKDTIDGKFEVQLLPSLQWLEKKGANDIEYAKFNRRLYSEILGPMYQKSKGPDQIKSLLCIGMADWIASNAVKGGYGYYGNALGKLRSDLSAQQVEQLIQLMESKKLNAFEQYLVSHNSISKDDVNDVAGTAWLRQFNWEKAAQWFAKVPAAYYQTESYKLWMGANPFADLILDTHAPTSQDTVRYTKLSFALKMQQLENNLKATTDPEKQAKLHYQMACGLYQMTYWGNSWMLVTYYWSGGEDYYPSFLQNSFGKEYYGALSAEDHYLKAFALSKDKNFRARCLFMAAKCDQKQVDAPQYKSFADYKEFDKARASYENSLKVNGQHFPILAKEYSNTPFYREAYNTCSYLKDFVKQMKK